MSAFSDALAAIRSIILIEDRVQGHGAKLEHLAELVRELDRRLVRVETTLDLLLRGSGGLPPSRAIAHDPVAES